MVPPTVVVTQVGFEPAAGGGSSGPHTGRQVAGAPATGGGSSGPQARKVVVVVPATVVVTQVAGLPGTAGGCSPTPQSGSVVVGLPAVEVVEARVVDEVEVVLVVVGSVEDTVPTVGGVA